MWVKCFSLDVLLSFGPIFPLVVANTCEPSSSVNSFGFCSCFFRRLRWRPARRCSAGCCNFKGSVSTSSLTTSSSPSSSWSGPLGHRRCLFYFEKPSFTASRQIIHYRLSEPLTPPNMMVIFFTVQVKLSKTCSLLSPVCHWIFLNIRSSTVSRIYMRDTTQA